MGVRSDSRAKEKKKTVVLIKCEKLFNYVHEDTDKQYISRNPNLFSEETFSKYKRKQNKTTPPKKKHYKSFRNIDETGEDY